MKRVAAGVLALVVATSASAAFAQETSARNSERRSTPDWRLYLSTGASFSTRETDDDPRTDYYRARFGGRVTKGPFRLSATMPYIFVRGPGAVIGSGEDDADDDLTSTDEKRQGWGDLRLTARYRLPKSALAGFELDFMGSVKLPTASREKRLGTGETDYAVGAELSRELGSFEPFVSARYRINGDRPDYDYKNTLAASVGTGVRLSRRTRASLSYDYSQSRIRGRSGFHMLDAGLGTRLSQRVYLSGSATVGLSERAPDFGVGTSLSWRAF